MSILKNGIRLTKRGILLNTILFAIFFTFYFVFSLHVLPKVIGPSNDALPSVQAIFSFTVAGTMFASSLLRHKLMKIRIIFASSAITSALTFLLLFVSNHIFILLSVFLVGVFFSIGQLSFFVHFWNTTSSEERGRIGGLIGFATLPFYYIVSGMTASNLNLSGTIILATTLSLVPIAATSLRPRKAIIVTKKEGNYPEKRTIILYSIPWILFSIVNATFAKNIALGTSQLVSPSFYAFLVVLQTIAALFGTLSGGFIADFFGRRSALALSVTLYGISMALRGFIQSDALFYFAFAAEGLGWGILLTLYSFVVWGDLSNKENSAKIYSIGLIAFYVAVGIGRLQTPINEISMVVSAFVGCSLIFLSNLPIALAPELLSSDFREKMRLKMHIKAAKKAAKEFQDQG